MAAFWLTTPETDSRWSALDFKSVHISCAFFTKNATDERKFRWNEVIPRRGMSGSRP